jgi:hypothetical protein
MKVYFAPEIPHVVLSQALATIDREIPDKEELVLVVQISSSEWFVATQLNIYFTGNYRASRHVIRDVKVMRDTGIEFFITGRYGRTIPHSAFGRAGETQEVCRRLRKAYIAYEDVPTQRVSKVAALKIASYDLESPIMNVLNVDGYEVLRREEGFLHLNEALLRQQFKLG